MRLNPKPIPVQRSLSLLCLILSGLFVHAQPVHNFSKGSFYFQWGWNQAQYTTSDIHFTGPGYDFTLHNVKAKDRPTHFKPDIYFNPETVTIPQTNVRIGYFINDRWSVSLGYDHMKYVATQYQTVEIDGHISGTGTTFDGEYNHESIDLTYSFLKYEHTDGLNYIFLGADYHDRLLSLSEYGISRGNAEFTGSLGADAGMVYPKTNSILLGMQQSDRFHLAGYGLSVNASINFSFFKYFYVGAQIKPGFIHLPDVKTTLRDADRASQHFFFLQENFYFGFKTVL